MKRTCVCAHMYTLLQILRSSEQFNREFTFVMGSTALLKCVDIQAVISFHASVNRVRKCKVPMQIFR